MFICLNKIVFNKMITSRQYLKPLNTSAYQSSYTQSMAHCYPGAQISDTRINMSELLKEGQHRYEA